MIEYKCINCENIILYNGRGRKPIRCKICQELYSKKLRRDSYRAKVKDKVKITKCKYKINKNISCDIIIPYVTNKPKYCPKHTRIARLEWMRKYYTGNKIAYCSICKRPIKYETKKPNLCPLCRCRQRIKGKVKLLKKKG